MGAEPKPFQELLREWFARWGQDLWTIARLSNVLEENAKEEFLEAFQGAHRKLRGTSKNWSELVATRVFLQQYTRAQKISYSSSPSSTGDEVKSALLSLNQESRTLVLALFRLQWPLEQVDGVFKLSPASLRFRSFQALLEMSRLSESEKIYKDANCARYDLRFVDHMLGLSWKDPVGLFTKEHFVQHQKACPRCALVSKRLNEFKKGLIELEVAPIPPDLKLATDTEISATPRLVSRRWISTWPLVLRIPAQLLAACLVVFAVLAIPYAGDIVPSQVARKLSPTRAWAFLRTQLEEQNLLQPAPPATVDVVATNDVVPNLENTNQSVVDQATKATEEVPAKPVDESKSVAAPEVVKAPVVSKTPAPAPVPAPTIVAKQVSRTDWPVMVWAPAAPVVPAPTPAPVAAAKPKPAPVPVAVATPEPAPTPTPALPKGEGEKAFYRLGAISADLDKDAARILMILDRYNVELAGELALGAHYLNGRYFHFTVPAAQYDSLIAALKRENFLKFTNQRNYSERRTPPDRRRVVFWIGEAK